MAGTGQSRRRRDDVKKKKISAQTFMQLIQTKSTHCTKSQTSIHCNANSLEIFFSRLFSQRQFHTFFFSWCCRPACVVLCVCEHICVCVVTRPSPDHAQSSYRVSADGSFLVSLASGMELSLSTEPLLPGGAGGGLSPTASRCNISLPGDHAPSLIEWRQRKEQSRTNYSTYERRLRVKRLKRNTTYSEAISDNIENPDLQV